MPSSEVISLEARNKCFRFGKLMMPAVEVRWLERIWRVMREGSRFGLKFVTVVSLLSLRCRGREL